MKMKLCKISLVILQFLSFVRSTEIRSRPVVPLGFPCDSIGQILAQLDCNQKLDCSKFESSAYRSFNGTCNNINFPKWGSQASNFERMVQKRDIIDPGDDMRFRVRSKSGDLHELPHARSVSAKIHDGKDEKAAQATLMLMQIGQIVDHDMTLTVESTLCNLEPCKTAPEPVSCCDFYLSPGKYNMTRPSICWPMPVPDDDPFYKLSVGKNPPRCLDFTRSMFSPCDETKEQFNEVTHYLDGSAIYGSTQAKTDLVREWKRGRLKVPDHGLLPFESDHCKMPGPDGIQPTKSSFLAGDVRVNENPGLQAVHTLWVEEHNRFAAELEQLDPFKTDEEIFQESRRYVIAEWQNVVFGEFLPLILGSNLMSVFDLNVNNNGSSLYDPQVKATIFTEFSTAAFRFGHSLIQDQFNLFHPDSTVEQENLDENFFVTKLMSDRKFEFMIRGMTKQIAGKVDNVIVPAVRNFLFKQKNEFFGGDLVAKNIQRGRDHKIGSYNSVRIKCGLKSLPDTFEDSNKPDELSLEIWRKFGQVYSFPEDIDLFPGGMAEKPAPGGGLIGPTFGCIIANQFHNVKFGDRYFFTHNNVDQNLQFCPESLSAIRRRTLRDILCDNLKFESLQLNVFKVESESNPVLPCSQRNQLTPSQLCLFGSSVPVHLLMQDISTSQSEVLVIAGGYDGRNIIDKVEVYSPDGSCNFFLAPLPKPIYELFLVYFKRNLYACGGNEGKECLKYVSGRGSDEEGWVVDSNLELHEPRWMSAVANSKRGFFYVSGGMQTESMMEYLDPTSISAGWRLVNERNHLSGRFRHCLVVLPNENLLVIGGHDGQTSVQEFDIISHTWISRENISYLDRHSCQLISNSEILIVGGDVSGWILNYLQGTVRLANNRPSVPRAFGAIHVVNDKVLIVGGEPVSNSVEEFDPEDSTFHSVSFSMMVPRSRFGSAVVPSNTFSHRGCRP